MSVKYGLNGNDLDWDSVMFLKSFIPQLEIAIYEGEAELDDDGYVTDSYYEGISDSNPSVVYYKNDEEVDIQQILKDGKIIEDIVDWGIVHDTNGNFVYTFGNVPDYIFTDDYIKERDEQEA